MTLKQLYVSILTIIKANLSYFISFALLLNIVFFTCLMIDPVFLVYPPGAPRSFWLNVFFVNYTFMGSWEFALMLISWMYFYKKKTALAASILIAFLCTAFFVQVVKNFMAGLGNGMRFYAESGQYLIITSQHTETSLHGLLSGYTATAFAIATMLAFRTNRNRYKILLLLAAILLGVSRIYLAGNNPADMIAGALAGVMGSITAEVGLFSGTRILYKIRRNLKFDSPIITVGETGSVRQLENAL